MPYTHENSAHLLKMAKEFRGHSSANLDDLNKSELMGLTLMSSAYSGNYKEFNGNKLTDYQLELVALYMANNPYTDDTVTDTITNALKVSAKEPELISTANLMHEHITSQPAQFPGKDLYIEGMRKTEKEKHTISQANLIIESSPSQPTQFPGKDLHAQAACKEEEEDTLNSSFCNLPDEELLNKCVESLNDPTFFLNYQENILESAPVTELILRIQENCYKMHLIVSLTKQIQNEDIKYELSAMPDTLRNKKIVVKPRY